MRILLLANAAGARGEAELRSAGTGEGARPHTIWAGSVLRFFIPR